MAVANVGSRWEEGNLIFFSKLTGNEILIFDAEGGKLVLPDGSSIETDGGTFIVTEPDGETIEVENKKLQVKDGSIDENKTKGADGEITVGDGDEGTLVLTITNGLITKIEAGE